MRIVDRSNEIKISEIAIQMLEFFEDSLLKNSSQVRKDHN